MIVRFFLVGKDLVFACFCLLSVRLIIAIGNRQRISLQRNQNYSFHPAFKLFSSGSFKILCRVARFSLVRSAQVFLECYDSFNGNASKVMLVIKVVTVFIVLFVFESRCSDLGGRGLLSLSATKIISSFAGPRSGPLE